MRRILTAAIVALAITGCQTLSEHVAEVEQRYNNRIVPFTQQEVEKAGQSLALPSLQEREFTQTFTQWKRDIQRAEVQHYLELGRNPVYFRMPVTLTKEMYSPDHRSFIVPVDTQQLQKAGGIEQTDYSIAFTSTNNLTAFNNAQRPIDRWWNKQILDNLVRSVATTEADLEAMKSINTKRARLFSDDKLKNVQDVSTSFYSTIPSERYYDRRRGVPAGATQSDRFGRLFVDAKPEEAASQLGRKLDLIFKADMIFKVPQTGQWIVIADGVQNLALVEPGAFVGSDTVIDDRSFIHAMQNDNYKATVINDKGLRESLTSFIVRHDQYRKY
ncbi:hypothetical protein [Vibrio mediterranei]|uniref:hypothetical protein n=1 Tax=Vibrio mediterranei TaxID=689 RepID=UPI004068AF5D